MSSVTLLQYRPPSAESTPVVGPAYDAEVVELDRARELRRYRQITDVVAPTLLYAYLSDAGAEALPANRETESEVDRAAFCIQEYYGLEDYELTEFLNVFENTANELKIRYSQVV